MRPNKFQAWLLGSLMTPGGPPAVSIVGGWGSGKSYAQAMWCHARWIMGDPLRPEDGLLIYPQAKLGAQVFSAGPGLWLEAMGWRYETTYKGKHNPHYLAPKGGGVRRVWLVGFYRPSTKSEAASNLEGINAGFACIDECNMFAGPEVASTAWGRLRAGSNPQMLLVGRPSLFQWWPQWATDIGGVSHRVSSAINRENIPAWGQWVRAMTQKQRDERLHCVPQAVEGAVFSDWSVKTWPDGNLAPASWRYSPGMRTYIALDLGFRHPSLLVIARDEDMQADVIVEEWNPYDIGLPAQGEGIRRLIERGKYQVDEFIGDTAGNAINDHTAKSSFQLLNDILGVRFNTSYAKKQERRNIANGVRRLRELVASREILCAQQMWMKSKDLRAGRVSLAAAMNSYKFREGSDEPIKDGNEHPIDALRYFVATARWGKPAPKLTPVTGASIVFKDSPR